MDTAIKDGDFQTNGSGLPVRISGACNKVPVIVELG